MRKKAMRIIALMLVMTLVLTGCSKENKYVRVGVEMSTAGISLYLLNTAHAFQSVSTYVFFSEDPAESIEKLNMTKQGIDIAYIQASDLGLIGKDDPLKVVFVDCLNTDGTLKGVWVANTDWMKNAPNYFEKYLFGMAMSQKYRSDNTKMTYAGAQESIKGLKEFDVKEYTDSMQLCAIYAKQNGEEIKDYPYYVQTNPATLEAEFADFASGSGEGYEICRKAYEQYCTGSDVKNFEEMFDFETMMKVIDRVEHPKAE